MEQGKVVLVGFGVDGGNIGDFGNLEVLDEVLQVELDGRRRAFGLDGQAHVRLRKVAFHEQALDAIAVADEQRQLAAFPTHVIQRAGDVHLLAKARDADGLGADGVTLAGFEGWFAGRHGCPAQAGHAIHQPQVFQTEDVIVVIQITEPLDLGQGIERGADGVVFGERALHGLDDGGGDAPDGAKDGALEILAFRLLQDESAWGACPSARGGGRTVLS